MSLFPDSALLPVLPAVCDPMACSEWVTYILSELWPILARCSSRKQAARRLLEVCVEKTNAKEGAE